MILSARCFSAAVAVLLLETGFEGASEEAALTFAAWSWERFDAMFTTCAICKRHLLTRLQI